MVRWLGSEKQEEYVYKYLIVKGTQHIEILYNMDINVSILNA